MIYSSLIDDVKSFDDPLTLFSAMIEDIKLSKHKVYLQTYKFCNDLVGQKFRDVLTQKAAEGVKVKILIDDWGRSVSKSFFSKLIHFGGEVEFFEKLKLSWDIFSANHLRNHRKLLIIDSTISYLGSNNITSYSISWREFSARFTGEISKKLENIFLEDFLDAKKIFIDKKKKTRILSYNCIKIIRDVPGNVYQPVRDKLKKMINNAKQSIVIETPYFLPSSSLRRAIIEAAHRGVQITVLVPLNSDVKLFDILRDKYFGKYFKNHIKIFQYTPSNLHSKIVLVDDDWFFFGSSNFDYRSFRFMYEINISGYDERILQILKNHVIETQKHCIEFNYEIWKKRHFVQKIIERVLIPFRHLF
ncbi:MAG: phosphatidylserine/phosphatidylglycerophosphate/cardiolipin synthase family protein [Bacteroidales bacterium]|jgi:cardiolipin synthase